MRSVRFQLHVEHIHLRSASEIEVVIRIGIDTLSAHELSELLPPKLDHACTGNFTEYRIYWRKGAKRFRFRFRPKHLIKEMRIGFIVEGFDDRGIRVSETIYKDLSLKNSFTKLKYAEKGDQRGIAEREHLFAPFEEFVCHAGIRPVSFLLGPPGIGKTTFLRQWRRDMIDRAKESKQPFPIIIIAPPNILPESSFREFIWEVDQAVYNDFNKYYKLLPYHFRKHNLRQVFRNCLSSLELPHYPPRSRNCDPNQASRASYSVDPVHYHAHFLYKLRICIRKLIDTGFFQSKIVIAIDDLHRWTHERMGWLLGFLYHLANSGLDAQTVITLRYRLGILLAADEYHYEALRYKFQRVISEHPSPRNDDSRQESHRSLPDDVALFLFSIGLEYQGDLETGELALGFRQEFESHGITLSHDLAIDTQVEGIQWRIKDNNTRLTYIIRKQDGALNIYVSLYFELHPLKKDHIIRMLEERLPRSCVDWWEPDLVRYLESLTGGNPQAVESTLYDWWEMCIAEEEQLTLNLRELEAKERKLRDLLELGQLSSSVVPDKDRVSLHDLWSRYRKALALHPVLRHDEQRRGSAMAHLQALTRDRPKILRDPQGYQLSEEEWQRRVGLERWDEGLVACLEQMGLVTRQGRSFRLTIPVLCIPILQERGIE